MACQTRELNVVPLPLSDAVPHRDQILFSLWLAGYKVDAEGYPEEVQEDFHGLVGSYLCGLEDSEDKCF